jgi:predicted nucleotidyltransferase
LPLFTVGDRQLIKDDVISIFRQTPAITALILIGSAVHGFIDRFSDIDLMSVVDDEHNIIPTRIAVSKAIKARHKTLCFVQLENKHNLQVYLLDNYLELNISYYTIDHLTAKSETYEIAFDKTDAVADKMRGTYEPHDFEAAYKAKLAEYSEQIWHFFFHAAVAIRRNQPWRAAADLTNARKYVIELKALRNNLLIDTRGKNIDNLPINELQSLQATVPQNLTPQSLTETLIRLTDAAYDELESYPDNPYITVTRERTLDYIRDVINPST